MGKVISLAGSSSCRGGIRLHTIVKMERYSHLETKL